MLTILKNITCYGSEPLGRRDIFIAGDKIEKITPPGQAACNDAETIDGAGLFAFPGLLDGHVHILGGGGEDGPGSRLCEMTTGEILKAGVTTVVGLLGADDRTKSLPALLAKARALEQEGLSTYLYTGSYALPPPTFTKDVTEDLLLVDKVVGVGEIALADHRSAHPSLGDLRRLCAKAHMGGLLSGKAGLVHFHLGEGKAGLEKVFRLLASSDFPPEMLLPTHINRSPRLFREGVAYVKAGGYIDLTAGEKQGLSLPDAVARLLAAGIDMQRVTASSDAGGSIPGGGAGEIGALLADIVACVTKKRIPPEVVFPLVTANAAARLKLPRKGALRAGYDADILILDKNFRLAMVFAMGEPKIDQRG